MSGRVHLERVYEKVREIGLPYEIKELEGSVTIKILSTQTQQKVLHPAEKFQFLTQRTLNGSSTKNWRAPPKKYEENSLNTRRSFPEISFF